jgi:hypothetical protein
MVFGFPHRPRPPATLDAVLRPDEHVLASAQDAAGMWFAATRYGVWKVPAVGDPKLFSWASISKARWQPPILQLIIADVVGELAGADLIVDRVPVNIEIAHGGKLTDVIHNRTRAGIISSTHHDLPDGGGWVVVRRVPGKDGVSVQVRLDSGTDPGAAHEGLAGVVQDALGPFRDVE